MFQANRLSCAAAASALAARVYLLQPGSHNLSSNFCIGPPVSAPFAAGFGHGVLRQVRELPWNPPQPLGSEQK
jgi:hypothetical protein